ncbi:MAG: hypothetical protein ACR2H5_00520, partial [Ktedonobacteraceae bacterium]
MRQIPPLDRSREKPFIKNPLSAFLPYLDRWPLSDGLGFCHELNGCLVQGIEADVGYLGVQVGEFLLRFFP